MVVLTCFSKNYNTLILSHFRFFVLRLGLGLGLLKMKPIVKTFLNG